MITFLLNFIIVCAAVYLLFSVVVPLVLFIGSTFLIGLITLYQKFAEKKDKR